MIDSISVGIIAAFVAIGAIGFIAGFIKGTFKSITDLLFLGLNVLISVLVATYIAKNIATIENVTEYFPTIAPNLGLDQATIDQVNGYLTSPELNATAVSLLLALVSVIVLPIAFIGVFVAFGVVFIIPKIIVNKLIMPSTKGIGLN